MSFSPAVNETEMSSSILRIHAFCLNLFVFFSIVALSTADLAGESSLEDPMGLNPDGCIRSFYAISSSADAMPPSFQNYDNLTNVTVNGMTHNGSLIMEPTIGPMDAVILVNHARWKAITGFYLTKGSTIATVSDVKLGGLWSTMLIFLPVLGKDGARYNHVSARADVGMFGIEDADALSTCEFCATNTDVGDFSDRRAEVSLVSLALKRDDSANIDGDVRSLSGEYQIYGISELLAVFPEPSTVLTSGIGIIVFAVSSTSFIGLRYGSRSKRGMAMKVCGRCFDKLKAHRHAKL